LKVFFFFRVNAISPLQARGFLRQESYLNCKSERTPRGLLELSGIPGLTGLRGFQFCFFNNTLLFDKKLTFVKDSFLRLYKQRCGHENAFDRKRSDFSFLWGMGKTPLWGYSPIQNDVPPLWTNR